MTKKISLLLASLVFSVLVLELAVRALKLETASFHAIGGFCQYDEELGWRLIPSLSSHLKGPGFSTHVKHSEQGLRDRYYSVERAAGRQRILILGDSVVWCWGVETEQCFTELIESALGGTDVIAAGVPSYGTAQELLFYERDLRRFRSDLVVLVVVGNDPTDNLLTATRPRFELREDGLVVTNQPIPRRKGAVKEWLAAKSQLFTQLNYSLQVMQEWLEAKQSGNDAPEEMFRQTPPDREAEAWQLMELLLDRLLSSVSEDGAQLAIVLAEGIEPLQRRLAGYTASRGIPYLDMVPRFEQARKAGVAIRLERDPHFTVRSHAILADEIL